jgi:serine/threonine protein kinase
MSRHCGQTAQSVGNYELLEVIGEGGAGTVYRGRHRSTGRVVAIKIMPAHLASSTVLLKRFEQEFRAASKLEHPNIVRALEFGGTSPTPFLVMEYVAGESLGQKIERDGRLDEARALEIIVQVCQGLQYAHEHGIIHRDIKPDNVIVTPEGLARLTDFGLVKEVLADQDLTRPGRGLGTPHFMAPEQFREAKKADVRCDVYSLGATLYQMVTGVLPFGNLSPLECWVKKVEREPPSPRAVVPELSAQTDWLIRRAMAADPAKRPGSCLEFVQELVGQPPGEIPPAPAAPPARLGPAVVGVVVAVAAAVAGWFLFR